MSNATIGLLIGGFIPAVFYAGAGILAKVSVKAGASMGPYLICVGLAIVAVGLVASLWNQEWNFTLKGSLPSLGMGLSWGIGTLLVAVALNHYHAPISQLTPLYNINTLFVVIFGLLFFAEWKDVQALHLVLGSILIIAGSSVVSAA